MWLSLAVPPGLLVVTVLLQQLESSMLTPRSGPADLVEEAAPLRPAQSGPARSGALPAAPSASGAATADVPVTPVRPAHAA